jgi:hypothetical protein
MGKTNGSWKRAQYARSVFNIPKRNAVTANAKRAAAKLQEDAVCKECHRGRVDIDEDIPVGAAFHFNADFDFDEMPTKNAQHSERIWSTEFVVTGLDANVELEFRPQGDEIITATLKVLDKRFGLPWLMDENYSNLDECVPFKFDTLEEAEFIAKKANDHSDSWLCNHLGMDAYVAKHIHEFVAWRPDPVLFLEPGDLILHVKWCKDFREGAGSLLVARKASDCARAPAST